MSSSRVDKTGAALNGTNEDYELESDEVFEDEQIDDIEGEGDDDSIVTDSSGMGPWVCNFCSLVGHEYFTEVTEEFIEDEFNLTGLSSMVPHYKEALELILDLDPEVPPKLPFIPLIEQSAESLYGLIHARFILTRQGLQDMAEKYDNGQFGICPRYLCHGTKMIPVGRHDMIGYETIRLYCPCCMDLYMPLHSRHMNIDGACFGTSFPGMFLEAYPEIERRCQRLRKEQFELKIYGFRISESSVSGARMKWLRQHPENPQQLLEMSNKEDGNEESRPDAAT